MTDAPAPPLVPAATVLKQRLPEMTDPGMQRSDMHVEDAIISRRSIRAFKPDPVPEPLMRRILEAARWAPSGSNIQPWKIHVLNGDSRQKYTDALIAAEERGDDSGMEYNYYAPEWEEPFLARRRACGFGLYGAMGVTREDREGRRQAFLSNYKFFGAGTGMLFWIRSTLEHGSGSITARLFSRCRSRRAGGSYLPSPKVRLANIRTWPMRCLASAKITR